MIADLAARSDQVVATGGGAVLRPENRAALRQAGTVIYLNVAPGMLYERTKLDPNRPLLQVNNPRKKIEEMLPPSAIPCIARWLTS